MQKVPLRSIHIVGLGGEAPPASLVADEMVVDPGADLPNSSGWPGVSIFGVWGRRYHAGLCFASAAVGRAGSGRRRRAAGWIPWLPFAAQTSPFHPSSYSTGASC
jgi:hypothetical protein